MFAFHHLLPLVGKQGSESSEHSWVEAAGISGWSRLGMHCLLPEGDTAWEEGLHIAHYVGRQSLGCNTSRLLHPSFAPLLTAKGEAPRCKVQ